MTNIEAITLETELGDEDAARDITEAVSTRHSIARKHVRRLRRRHPNATPAQVIQMLEAQYTTAITTTGAAIAAGGIAISLIPVGGAAAKATHHGARFAIQAAAKGMALNAAKSGAGRLLPAGEQQLQFELTSIFGLAIADIHGIEYDKDQAHALVYGLTNERVSQQQIAKMAADVASLSSEATSEATVASPDGAQWATTLAAALPGGAAQSLVRTMQTGQLDTVRDSMSGKQQAAVDYGVKAVAGGVTRFVFGREVVASARTAFPEAPGDFPAHLAVPAQDDDDAEPNRALAAMEDAAKATGTWIADAAGTVGNGVATGAAAVGTGVATAAGTVTRPFRSVDLDGDGIPDEPQALTAVKGVGGAIAGAADAVGGNVVGLFRKKRA